MFCINCGETINDGELICKGCGGLDSELRDELLAFSEKSGMKASSSTCEKCGGDIGEKHHYCNTCGKNLAC
jgi:RNA polymerase subunit RPABC4/transcription elongation factor Spt4